MGIMGGVGDGVTPRGWVSDVPFVNEALLDET